MVKISKYSTIKIGIIERFIDYICFLNKYQYSITSKFVTDELSELSNQIITHL